MMDLRYWKDLIDKLGKCATDPPDLGAPRPHFRCVPIGIAISKDMLKFRDNIDIK